MNSSSYTVPFHRHQNTMPKPKFQTKNDSINHSSSLFIALDLALRASARPPARLGPPPCCPEGVTEPLPVGVPPFEYPLSLGVLGAAGLRAAGRFAGGAGGVGLALTAGAPFAFAAAGAGGGGGLEAAGGAGGGGGGARTSSRYAAGVQPDADPSILFPSHHPAIPLVRCSFTEVG